MIDDFTLEMLKKATEQLPHRIGLLTEEWWSARRLDENTIHHFTLEMKEAANHPVSPVSAMVVGLMIGVELGKLYCDPSYQLAYELAQDPEYVPSD